MKVGSVTCPAFSVKIPADPSASLLVDIAANTEQEFTEGIKIIQCLQKSHRVQVGTVKHPKLEVRYTGSDPQTPTVFAGIQRGSPNRYMIKELQKLCPVKLRVDKEVLGVILGVSKPLCGLSKLMVNSEMTDFLCYLFPDDQLKFPRMKTIEAAEDGELTESDLYSIAEAVKGGRLPQLKTLDLGENTLTDCLQHLLADPNVQFPCLKRIRLCQKKSQHGRFTGLGGSCEKWETSTAEET